MINRISPGIASVLSRIGISILLIAVIGCGSEKDNTNIKILLDSTLDSTNYTGRLFLAFGRSSDREPRLQIGHWRNSSPMFAMDVEEIEPGTTIQFDKKTLGYPYPNIKYLPPGKYYVQAILNVYSKFNRADGHTVWLPNDQWEGQVFNISPGNLVSKVDTIVVTPDRGFQLDLTLDKILPAVDHMTETKHVKKMKIKSELLSEFWGQDMFVGAYVTLPSGYYKDANMRYPVVYHTGYFEEYESDFFNESSQFFKKWLEPGFPQMIIVHLMHPSPYNSHCFAANSENCGPVQDAVMEELIPYIEKEFRINGKADARIIFGGSSGGLMATRLQVFYPDFFGGLWAFAPDVVDFSHFQLTNIYQDTNFYSSQYSWIVYDKPAYRNEFGQPYLAVRQYNQLERVLGSKGRSASEFDTFSSAFGPLGEHGYPKPLYDKVTGRIDSTVAGYMKRHDLLNYLKNNWSKIGPSLVGKLHFITPDMDSYYLNEPTYELEAFLENTTEPYYDGQFIWGRPRKEHGWTPWDEDLSEFFKVVDRYLRKDLE